MKDLPLVLTVPDVCRCTGMSRWQIIKYVDAGALPSLPRVKGKHEWKARSIEWRLNHLPRCQENR